MQLFVVIMVMIVMTTNLTVGTSCTPGSTLGSSTDDVHAMSSQGEAAAALLGGREQRIAQQALHGLLRFARAKPLGIIGGVIIVIAVAVSIGAPFIAPYDPREFVGAKFEPPNSETILGTDALGRDVLTRVMYGGRLSLFVGLIAVFAGVTVGLLVAMLSGYAGGWADAPGAEVR